MLSREMSLMLITKKPCVYRKETSSDFAHLRGGANPQCRASRSPSGMSSAKQGSSPVLCKAAAVNFGVVWVGGGSGVGHW